jgi:broad specificity phosphatase PhoE
LTEYVLIRHGWAAWKEIPGGRAALTDLVPLSDEGIKRVETTAQRVRAMLPDAVLSSPVTRALQSGHLIARDLGLALHVEPDLHEWLPERSGRWPGRQVFTENLRAMLAAPGDDASAWESLEDVRRRVGAVLARYDHLGTVAVVTHAVVIHALTGLDLPPGGLVRWSPAAGTRVREGEPSAMQDRIVRWPHPLPPVVTAYHLPGAVDVSALDRALTALMVRHDILQCRYVRRNGGTSREQLPDGEIVCPTTPVDSIDAESLNALWAEAATRTEHPGWPLLRAHVLRGDTAILALGIDRAIADPWTVSVLEHDLAALYHADTGHRPVLLPPSAGFIGSSAERSRLRAGPHVPAHADTATWQRRAAVAAVPRTVLDTGRTRSLEDACRAHGGSLFAGVAAAGVFQ